MSKAVAILIAILMPLPVLALAGALVGIASGRGWIKAEVLQGLLMQPLTAAFSLFTAWGILRRPGFLDSVALLVRGLVAGVGLAAAFALLLYLAERDLKDVSRPFPCKGHRSSRCWHS